MSNSITLAEYVTRQLDLCGKSQKEVAREAGYEQANNITMIKKGTTKVAIERVPALAKALGVDPVHLLRLALQEYRPEVWETIEEVLAYVVSANERVLIETVREATAGEDPRFDEEVLEEVQKLAAKHLAWRSGAAPFRRASITEY